MNYASLVDEIESNIATYGLHIISSFDARGRLFSYTIGLTDDGWPELILVGPTHEVASKALNEAVIELQDHEEKTGLKPRSGSVVLEPFHMPGKLREIPSRALLGYMPQALLRQQRSGGPLPSVLQLVWPDEDWLFPDDAHCDPCVRVAQDLDCLPGVH